MQVHSTCSYWQKMLCKAAHINIVELGDRDVI